MDGHETRETDDVRSGVLSPEETLARLRSSPTGLSSDEVAVRRARFGINAVRTHEVTWAQVLLRQLRSPLLLLLFVTATASFFVGERTDAVLIAAILAASVGLGFLNEFRAERSASALRDQITHTCVVLRDGSATTVDVTDLVPGDVVVLRTGEVVPADLRLLTITGLQCDEAVLTGESLPVDKSVDAVPPGSALADLTCCALMGTIVSSGSGSGVATTTGADTHVGRIAVGLAERQPETEFQVGLRQFSLLLVRVALTLTVAIVGVNLLLRRPLLDALLFALAIAVGITPQLLPAVVSTSLASGARSLAARKVLVKRLVCIEDLGDVATLFTDKTGTLTQGHITFQRALVPDGDAAAQARLLLLAVQCTDVPVDPAGRPTPRSDAAANPLDAALLAAPEAVDHLDTVAATPRRATLPFDHVRRLMSVMVDDTADQQAQAGPLPVQSPMLVVNPLLVVKGAPEAVLERCIGVRPQAQVLLDREFARGSRVVAVASRRLDAAAAVTTVDERDLTLEGFLVFVDEPRHDAGQAVRRLASIGVAVKVVTGDNAVVAQNVCLRLGMPVLGVLTGAQVDAMDDDALAAAVPGTTVFARVSPEAKARIVRAQRTTGTGVAFLGDGVNDALAIHAADVGISVESATDVAKDAADVVLLEKSLSVLADGVVEGRRIFANTIKYVLMGTSSNFGNMFSAAGASVVLSFLPMLPSQLLLNNLLYDAGQLTIPTDEVDEEQLQRPSHWDVTFLRRFMLFFGPVSSVFDALTFVVMLQGFHAGPALFRSGWFVESLATQTLVIFAIRTHRVPFWRSRPSVPLLLSALVVVGVGAAIPNTPFGAVLGFAPLTVPFYLALLGMLACYVALIEVAKTRFYAEPYHHPRIPAPPRRHTHRLRRRTARFTAPPAIST